MLTQAFVLSLFFIGCFASDVLVFTDNDFQDQARSHPLVLVEFYAPWCGHCKRLAPEYEIAATKLKSSDPPVALAKVDCTVEKSVCEKYGVSGYPTLKVFKDGELAYDYNGERNADGIVKYMRSKAGPVSKHLSTIEEFEKFISSSENVVVGFFDDVGSALHKAFDSAASALGEDFRFGYTTDKELHSKHGFKDNILIFTPKSLHSKFEEKVKKYTGDVDAGKIRTWIESNVMGLAGIRTSSNQKYFGGRPLVKAFFDVDYEKNPKGTNYYRNRLMKAAKEVMEKTGKVVHLALSNVKDAVDLGDYGIEGPDEKKVYIAGRDHSNKKFRMPSEFSVEAFKEWLTNFLEGKESAYLKSEPVPSSNSDHVKVVVAQNFDEIVNDPKKDVLIEFYAPWCGHCKSLAPKYEELAEKLKNEKDIVIAKMDATANDVPSEYKVEGFPTIYFASKDNKKSPKLYNGGREVADMTRFLAESSTDSLSGFDRKGNPTKGAKVDL